MIKSMFKASAQITTSVKSRLDRWMTDKEVIDRYIDIEHINKIRENHR